MPRGKKAPTGANGTVALKISTEAYKAAEAKCEDTRAQVLKATGMNLRVTPSHVIERMLLGGK